ncbi:polyphosphate polymerase domain-containing protein [Puniceicoccaceae bacterium K14]|nr:polyphosphate polymerase domain-containing protein [Puniceicoccaceae bacterium K14]
MKFLIPGDMVESVRHYITGFCVPDPMSEGSPPSYKVTTLQLDSPDLSLHFAKSRELKNRFKLRVRSYGEADGTCPVFIEIKRKFEHIVSKSRAKLDRENYVEVLDRALSKCESPDFDNKKDKDTFAEFIRLSRAMDAGPVMRIRYNRECWVGVEDTSVRITLDTRLEYQSTSNLQVFNDADPWLRADVASSMKGVPSAVILELKSGLKIPDWIISVVRHFRLQRTGYCKYSEAVNLESTFGGNKRFAMTGFRSNLRNCS